MPTSPASNACPPCWMRDPGPLTDRLKQAMGNGFAIERIKEGVSQPSGDERTLLNLPARRWVWCREVLLKQHQQPWVFARAVLPLIGNDRARKRLILLGDHPLGSLLFNANGEGRLAAELRQLTSDSWLHHYLHQRFGWQAQHWWQRTSLFEFRRRPLLLTEVFLPDLPAHSIR